MLIDLVDYFVLQSVSLINMSDHHPSDIFISEVLKLYNTSTTSNTSQVPNPILSEASETHYMSSLNSLMEQLDDRSNINLRSFKSLQSLLHSLCEGSKPLGGYERAFPSLFGREVNMFTEVMNINLEQLERYLVEDTPQMDKIYAAYQVLHKQFHRFINSKYTDDYDFDSLMAEKCFLNYTGVTVNEFRDLLL